MSRARIAALALVNWKGVFYERYLLDRHVTALEGANGAGKTTVMIAAYVVLLPDMTRLRFTNLGESGATGGDRGIWGRLGEPGRPSYAALELELAGERLLCGVRLTRTTEPTVEPTAFIVSGLSEGVRLSDILLVRRDDGDHVPELDEIKAQVARAGAQIEVFRATRDYFASLFERGITPLHLRGEEERNKWNDMLRTSMTGGISRALGSELRSFLLREESGLADTLSRMRENLDSCRRTRLEVYESRQLEREISAIYEAGLAMFAAALHAVRGADREAQERVRDAAEAIERAQADAAQRSSEAEHLAAREVELGVRSGELRTTIQQLTAAEQRRLAAAELAERLASLQAEQAALDAELSAARSRAAALEAEREQLQVARGERREAYDRASLGLLHVQQGLEELNRRAHAQRELTRSLQAARELLQRPELTPDDALGALSGLAAERDVLERERAGLAREAADLDARREEHERALAALAELEDSPLLGDLRKSRDAAPLTAAESAHARARAWLAICAELEAGGERAPRLEREQLDAQRLATRQQAARALAATLDLSAGESVADALTAVERELIDLEPQLHANADALAGRQTLENLRQRHAELDQRAACYQLARQAAERLGQVEGLDSRPGLLALRDRLVSEQLGASAQRDQLEREREALALQIAELTRGGTLFDAELLRVRDELGAELLAGRFEELETSQASWVEARLGPLVNALVVDDPDSAATALAKLEHGLGSVHLVRAGASLELEPPAAFNGETVVIDEPYGVRVARLASAPSLGRRAREAKLHELSTAASAHATTLEQLAAALQHNAAQRRDADVLWTHAEVWLAGDPAQEREALELEIARLHERERAAREAEQAARTRVHALRTRAEGLRRLLPDAPLLEPPDHAERARELTHERLQLQAARGELSRLSAARAELARLIDVLRSPPADDAALAVHAARAAELDAALDRSYRARLALEEVHAQRHAAEYADAQAALDAQAQLSPALEQQHAAARAELQAVEAEELRAQRAWQLALTELQAVEARAAALGAHRERAEAELKSLGGVQSQLERELAANELAAAQAELTRLEAAAKSLVAERALAAERALRAQSAVAAARSHHAAESGAAQPLAERWQSLRATAEAAGLLHAALAGAPPLGQARHGSLQLQAEAASKRELLADRVARTRGGEELLQVIRDSSGDAAGDLAIWQAVRAWLGRRVPAQIAEVADPLLALLRLRDHLDMLEARLKRQEGDLRGSSEDVARGIDVQLRRAQSQVRRLNQQLEGIHFGSIHGIRIDMRRIERMEQILLALRDGQAQELLFSSSLPIEEALDEIFKRYGGGGRSGGQKLLDYREYVELAVEIRRQAATGWEPANPTRLSTGEAIGVGAALMMVVLTEWERDANLLRARGKLGSLRFLFLDEANRLSRDNLGVLFDMCRTLDLQLLVAAPEVARADGNTTYRLVRHTTEDGREEVIVSGRRAVPSSADEEPSADVEDAELAAPDVSLPSAAAETL